MKVSHPKPSLSNSATPATEMGIVRPPEAASMVRPGVATPPSREALGSSTPGTTKGKLWWFADNQQEAEKLKTNLLAKGVEIVELQPEPNSSRVHVHLTLDKGRAKEILGHEPDEEEWLEPEMVAAQMAPEKPSLCYVLIPGNPLDRSIGIVKRGESGYYPATHLQVNALPDKSEKGVRAFVDDLNNDLGVTQEQAEKMFVGSMFGWDVPGAN